MTGLPSGTVTLLFTDVEGSTLVLRSLGDRYVEALTEHRQALRSIFTRHGGSEVDTQGDSFFVAFASASAAVAAAAAMQEASADGPIRVRIGIHTGEPVATDEGYVGIDVVRGARIAAAAHGGQVLISSATAALVNTDLRDLGAHRLKDLDRPERIYQLGFDEFPPIRSLGSSSLPRPETRLVGRQADVDRGAQLLADEAVRLVTLVGPPGVGKTRLAIELASGVAGSFQDGVFFVSLAGIKEPELVPAAIAQALGISGVPEAHLAGRRTLLLLDSFEHLAPAAAFVADLLAAAPNVKLLVTSREPLHLSAERQVPVRPLADAAAASLFVERACAVRPDFQSGRAIFEICQRLDHLPLAIELAAGLTNVLSTDALLARLETRLVLLSGGPRDAPARHRTLRDTIRWSYELLDPAERDLFTGLAVFVDGFSLDAAEDVTGATIGGLASLVDKNLVRREDERFSMLETIREYALERLDEAVDPRRRHAEYFLALAAHRPRRGDAFDQVALYERLEVERNNLRAALAWFADTGDDEQLLRLVAALGQFWRAHGPITEGRRWLEEALQRAPDVENDELSEALTWACSLARRDADYVAAKEYAERRVEKSEEMADRANLADALVDLALVHWEQKLPESARPLLARAIELARAESGDSHARAAFNFGLLNVIEQRYDEGASLLDEALQEASEQTLIAYVMQKRGEVARAQGRPDEELELLSRSLDLHARLGSREGVSDCLESLANTLVELGRNEEAATLLGAAEAVRLEAGIHQSPLELEWRTKLLAQLRSRFIEERFDAAFSKGARMAFGEAVAFGVLVADLASDARAL